MAKSSGMGMGLVIGGYDLANDTASIERIAGGPALLDMTGIDKSAHERIGGLLDGGLDFTSFFNDATNQAHALFSALPTTDRQLIAYMAATIGASSAGIVAKQLDYAPTRAADQSLLMTVPGPANGFALEWGNLLTAGLRTDSTATNGTAHDGTVATTTGWSAYLAVTAITGTNVVVALEDSADNVTFAAVTSGAFASATAARTVERIEGASGATLRRYVRAVTTGTFSSATFIVMVCRHPTGATA